MKRSTHIISLVCLSLIFLACPASGQDAGETRLRLSVENVVVAVGQELTVDILAENAPLVYGADVRITFEPAMLEVVDADESRAGIQVTPGDFLDLDRSYVLQHNVDNAAGVIDYALALLNPAPAVQGSGLLAQVTFRGKVAGPTAISITEGLFGTRGGERIAPVFTSTEIHIGDMFTHIIKVENPFEQAVYFMVSDTLDTCLEYILDTFAVDGVLQDNSAFVSGDLLYTDHLLNAGETLFLSFDVRVLDGSSVDWNFENSATITAYLDPRNIAGTTLPLVDTPEQVVPEPSTLILFGIGLIGGTALLRRKTSKK